jgi:hypothetical protein
LHGDFIILKNNSIGGNTIIFVTVDERSNYLVEVPLSTEGTKSVQAAGEGLLLVYNTYHHRVRQLTKDDECDSAFSILILEHLV